VADQSVLVCQHLWERNEIMKISSSSHKLCPAMVMQTWKKRKCQHISFLSPKKGAINKQIHIPNKTVRTKSIFININIALVP
jgi:hypothetical protein